MSSDLHWYTLDINPDPWAIGPIGVGRRGGKPYAYVGQNAQLHAYKEGVKELLTSAEQLPIGQYALTFFFWRRLDSGAGRTKHGADATNLIKATEDALQDVLFKNDRDVRDVRGVVVEQGPEVRPFVVVRAEMWEGLDPNTLPDFVWEQVERAEVPELPIDSNVWPPS